MLDFFLISIHLVIFQSMFFFKNILLHKKLQSPIKGKNIEAVLFTFFVPIFISSSLIFSFWNKPLPYSFGIPESIDTIASAVLMVLSLIISAAALINLRDSWRVGIIEKQKTALITTGIYQFSRNPYFVSYILLFTAYTLILQSYSLLMLSIIGTILIHLMILREEKFLAGSHGDAYLAYKKKVPRYIFV